MFYITVWYFFISICYNIFRVDVYVWEDIFYHYTDAYINSDDGALHAGKEQQYTPIIDEESDYGGTCDTADTMWILFTATKTGTLDVSTDTRVH